MLAYDEFDTKEVFKMENYRTAGDGLKKMYYAEWGFMICAVLGAIPLIGIVAGIAKIAVAVLSLLGLYSVGQVIPKCKNAFYLTIVSMIITVLDMIINGWVINTLFSIMQSVTGIMISYYVCNPVADFMSGIGATDIANDGRNVWKINLVCYLVSIVISLLLLIPIINIIAGLFSVIVAIVQIVAYVLYMVFLNKGYKRLEA